MSNVTLQTVPVPSQTYTRTLQTPTYSATSGYRGYPQYSSKQCSTVGYWVFIGLLLLVIAGLIFWLVWVWKNGNGSSNGCTPPEIPGGEITGTAAGITGNWGDIDGDVSIVMYAFDCPIRLNSDGTPVDNVASVTAATGAKSMSMPVNWVSSTGIKIRGDTKYYVSLVGTKKCGCYHSINDIVFTQCHDSLDYPQTFSIESLCQQGGIMSEGTFTNNNVLGQWQTNSSSELIDVDSTEQLLCNVGGTLVQATKDDGTITYTQGDLSLNVNPNQCKWIYNPSGENRWCLTSEDSSGNKICMKRNDGSTVINVVSGNTLNAKWSNYLYLLDLES